MRSPRATRRAPRAVLLSCEHAAVVARADATTLRHDTNHTRVVTRMFFMVSTVTKTSAGKSATAIRFPEELHERLRTAADERHYSINFMVVKAVEDFLDRLIPVDELKLTRG